MKYRLISIVLLFLLLVVGVDRTLRAQDQANLRDRADKYYREFQYVQAASIYLQLSDKKNPYLHDVEKLASCYAKMNKFRDAEFWFKKVVLYPKSDPINLLNYGRILKLNSNYVHAKDVLLQYAVKTRDTQLVANEIEGCDSAQVWIEHPTNLHLYNLSNINTVRAEFSIFPLACKSAVYFVGEPELKLKTPKYGWTGNSFLKIYTAEVSNDSLLNVQLADIEMNKTVFHVGPITSNKAGDVFIFTRTYTGDNHELSKVDGYSYRDCNMELYIQTKANGNWNNPVSFKYNDVKNYSVGHATFSQDEKVLYFVSDMPGGYGGTDIWCCELQNDGSWGECINAGQKINTSGNELFPFIAPNGSLFFSSNGLVGMGGLDVFRSYGEKANWSNPINLHYPLNSSADDFAYWTDKTDSIGYVSSNRENGKGDDDIYAFNYKEQKVVHILTGTVYDKRTLLVLPDVSVVLFDQSNNIVAKQQTMADGTFQFEIDKRDNYLLQGTKLSYLSDTATIKDKMKGNDSIQISLYLDPLLVKGKIFRLKNIVYDFDKYNIRLDAEVILNELVLIMQENTTLKIELGSHTDSRGNDVYNQNLSQKRAQSVVDYLVSKGITRHRMIARGYGESKLLNKCTDGVECTDVEHQVNRRTEFKVLDY